MIIICWLGLIVLFGGDRFGWQIIVSLSSRAVSIECLYCPDYLLVTLFPNRAAYSLTAPP